MEILQILPFRKKWKMQNKNPWNSSFHAQFIFYTTHPNITSWIQHAPRLFWHGKQENDQSILGSSLKVAPPPPQILIPLSVASFRLIIWRGVLDCLTDFPGSFLVKRPQLTAFNWKLLEILLEMEALINSSKKVFLLFFFGFWFHFVYFCG